MKKKGIVLGVLVCLIIILSGILIHNNQTATKEKDGKESQEENVNESEQILEGDELAWNSYNRVRKSIVKIDMGDFSGSGIVFQINEEKIMIVSSAHLLSHYESGVVTFSNGAVSIGWIDGLSEQYDVGFMSVYLSDLEEEKVQGISAVEYDRETYDALQAEDAIFQVGSSSGVAADFYIGTLSAKEWYLEEFGSDMMYNFCKATAGMSGGGTFTLDGKLVGLISGSYMEESCSLSLPFILEAYDEVFGSGTGE